MFDSARRTEIALFVATFVTIWGLVTHGTYAGAGDEPHYLMIARSVAFDGDLDLGNDYADEHNLIGAATLEHGAHARPGVGGTLRPVHDIGLPVVAAPVVGAAYAAARYLGDRVPASWLARFRLNTSLLLRHQISLLMACIAGLAAIETWRLLLMTGASSRHAFGWALLGVLSPPFLSHAFLFFTEVPSALLVLVILRRLLARSPSPPSALVTGLMVGFLCLVHVRNAPIALGLLLVALADPAIRHWRLAQFAGAFGAMLAVRTAVHWWFWGAWLFDEHARLGELASIGSIVREALYRITGLVFDQEFGLLVYAPIYVLAPAGMILLWRDHPRLGKPIASVTVLYLAALALPMVNVHGWQGGFSPAARLLVPVAPLLLIAASVCARGVRAQPVAARFVWIVVALQLAIDALVWQQPKRLWNDGDGISELACALPSALGSLWTVLPSWQGPSGRVWPVWSAAVALVVLGAWLLRTARTRLDVGNSALVP